MKIRHKFIHYIKQLFLMVIISSPCLSQSLRNIYIIWIIIALDLAILLYIFFVHFNDYLLLTDGCIDGNTFHLHPQIGFTTLSVPRFRVRSCELKRFLFWNTIIIEGSFGVTYVMHNMVHAKRFVKDFKNEWDLVSDNLRLISKLMP